MMLCQTQASLPKPMGRAVGLLFSDDLPVSKAIVRAQKALQPDDIELLESQ